MTIPGTIGINFNLFESLQTYSYILFNENFMVLTRIVFYSLGFLKGKESIALMNTQSITNERRGGKRGSNANLKTKIKINSSNKR